MIVNIHVDEVSPWELCDIDFDSLLSLCREDTLQLLWMPLNHDGEGFDAFILHILAPKGCIFWNFRGDYLSFFYGSRVFRWKIISSELAEETTLNYIHHTCSENDSFYSDVILHGLSDCFGDKFFHKHSYRETLTLAQFYQSILVSSELKTIVEDYFVQQVNYFKSTSFREIDFQRLLTVDVDNVDCSPEAQRFSLIMNTQHKAIAKENHKKIVDEISQFDSFDENLFEWMLLKQSDNINSSFYCDAQGVKLENFKRDLDAIMNFRVSWAIKNLPLCRLESVKCHLNEPYPSPWGQNGFSVLRNQLREKLDSVLCKFPIIQTNPYETYRDHKIYLP